MREVKRKANAGERIKIVNAIDAFGDYDDGAILTVACRDDDESVIVEDYGVVDGVTLVWDDEYVVLTEAPEEEA